MYIMKIVIMAGGKGTRIASVNSEVPKPMIEILGKPILQYQVESLRAQGFQEFIFIIGHQGEIIQGYFKDGSDYGIKIDYIVEKEPLGTAGALYFLKSEINEDFLLINGDIIFDINVQRFLDYHKEKKGLVTLFTHPNNHPYDSGIIQAINGKVINWLHKEDERLWYRNRVNAGIHLISPRLLDMFSEPKKMDLDRDVLKPLISKGELYAYDSPEYVKDMGTPDRYYAVIEDIKKGKVKAKNLSNKQRAVFLDRDGTLNKYVGFLTKIEELELLDGVAEAVKMINESGMLAIIVTNQPVIARGEVDWKELNNIHNKLETLLGNDGAYIDAIYCCPHHPDKGFEGERVEYKIDCDCRKPKPGLIMKAAQDFNIDLQKSWMVGDSLSDIYAGVNAGCKTALISSLNLGNTLEIKETSQYRNLLEFVKSNIR